MIWVVGGQGVYLGAGWLSGVLLVDWTPIREPLADALLLLPPRLPPSL